MARDNSEHLTWKKNVLLIIFTCEAQVYLEKRIRLHSLQPVKQESPLVSSVTIKWNVVKS